MVRRTVPLSRRLRAHAGKLINAAIWFGAVFAAGILYLAQDPQTASRAIAAVRQHPVHAPASGRLASVAVQNGQRVSAGEQLAVIEVPGLQQQLAAAQAELLAIREESGLDGVDSERKFAKDADAAQARWLSARVSLESQRAMLIGLDLELGRLETPGAAVPAIELEAKRAARQALKAEIAAREEEYGALERAWSSSRQRAGIESSAAIEARVAAASAQVEAIRAVAESCVLRAQVAGTVTGVTQDGFGSTSQGVPAAGTWIQAGVPAFSLTEATTQEAVVYVSPLLAQQLAEGSPLALVGTGGERIDARVASIGPALEVVPLRQQRDITMPEWGVPVTLRAVDAVFTPGEALSVDF